LGLKKFGKSVFIKDTPQNRGMLFKVGHLIELTKHAGEAPHGARAKARAAKAARAS
jgi:hypothetical protein